MAREIIKPDYNQPCVFKLGNAPSLVEGAYGHQWRYFVNDDEAMLYLGAPAKEAIDATGAGNGANIALTKTRQGRSTVWHAEKVESTPVPVEFIPGEVEHFTPWEYAAYQRRQQRQAPAAKAQEPMVNLVLHDHEHELTPKQKAEQWERKLAAQQAARAQLMNGKTNGNGNGHHAPPQPEAKATPPHRPGAKLLAMALFSAIDAAKLAQDYAASQGLKLQFTSEDVRCMGNTLYIDQRKEGR